MTDHMVRNAAPWIDEAGKEFLEVTKPIRVTVADSSVYAKHIVRSKSIAVEEMQKIARQFNSSFLLPEITS